MKECRKRIEAWLLDHERSNPPAWDSMPNIDLYMDQVLTILERQSTDAKAGTDAKPITASMINNYVKDGTIPKPYKKKYNKEHLAFLLMLTSAKQVLPISDIAKLLNTRETDFSIEEKYVVYSELQRQSFEMVAAEIRKALDEMGDQCDKAQLYMLASKLALEADIMVSASKMIIRKALAGSEDAQKQEDISLTAASKKKPKGGRAKLS